MQNGEEIRLEMLDTTAGLTVGWVVCRACNVYQAYAPPRCRPNDDGVVDLLRDGVLLGQVSDAAEARELVLESVAKLVAENLFRNGIVIEELADGALTFRLADDLARAIDT